MMSKQSDTYANILNIAHQIEKDQKSLVPGACIKIPLLQANQVYEDLKELFNRREAEDGGA